ncbi:ATP-binding cassette domain-containing protein [Diaphorobacter ruginosibacter]|uniref:ABC transporter ATP-binding protein n=1 Tax=Diaphorobacter ruginosibacter TaxID=1715720 RepID=UPI0033409956
MLEMRELTLRLGGRTVLERIALRLLPGERVGLVGASGAGKSSLLRLACSLQKPSSGHVGNGFARTALLFQEPRLLPWRRVLDNLMLPLCAAGIPHEQARLRALQWLERVELEASIAQSWPRELSGGMAQRVSLARALSMEPDLLLLDEPFSALDPALRQRMARLCAGSLDARGAAMLCVSHHPQELAAMVSRCWEVRDAQVRPRAMESLSSLISNDMPASRQTTP